MLLECRRTVSGVTPMQSFRTVHALQSMLEVMSTRGAPQRHPADEASHLECMLQLPLQVHLNPERLLHAAVAIIICAVRRRHVSRGASSWLACCTGGIPTIVWELARHACCGCKRRGHALRQLWPASCLSAHLCPASPLV